jgi:hypothetical protein
VTENRALTVCTIISLLGARIISENFSELKNASVVEISASARHIPALKRIIDSVTSRRNILVVDYSLQKIKF